MNRNHKYPLILTKIRGLLGAFPWSGKITGTHPLNPPPLRYRHLKMRSGVMLGGIVGHRICALIAVIGGRELAFAKRLPSQKPLCKRIASHISERTITIIGGLLFILLAIVTLITGR